MTTDNVVLWPPKSNGQPLFPEIDGILKFDNGETIKYQIQEGEWVVAHCYRQDLYRAEPGRMTGELVCSLWEYPTEEIIRGLLGV